MFKTTAIAAAVLCTAGLFAAPAAFAKTTEVHYKDLDLTTATGQNQLQARLEKAARSVCRVERPATGTHIEGSVDRACYRQALAETRERVAAVIGDNRLGG